MREKERAMGRGWLDLAIRGLFRDHHSNTSPQLGCPQVPEVLEQCPDLVCLRNVISCTAGKQLKPWISGALNGEVSLVQQQCSQFHVMWRGHCSEQVRHTL